VYTKRAQAAFSSLLLLKHKLPKDAKERERRSDTEVAANLIEITFVYRTSIEKERETEKEWLAW
jgi:hypothetical protein